jgi:D-inositol-3-phosphate glycosyltransferase
MRPGLIGRSWGINAEYSGRYSGRMPGLHRIAMVSMHSSPVTAPGTGDSGGMNVSLIATALQLSLRGVEVELLTRATGEPRVTQIADGVTVHELAAGAIGPMPKERLVEVADEFGEAVALLSGRSAPRYDLLHANYWLSGISTLPVAIELGLPFVQSFHTLGAMKNLYLAPGETPEPEGRLRAENYLANQADAIVATSVAEVTSLIDRVGAPAGQIWVVSPGVDSAQFTPVRASSEARVRRKLGVEPERPILVVVGRVQPHKGQELAIRALAELSGDLPVLAVVGEPTPGAENYRVSLKSLASELGVSSAVRFVGALDREDLANLLAAASITLLPSYSETFGLIALESAASGTPVIVSSVVGATGSVAPGISGVILESREPREWAATIATLLTDPIGLGSLAVSAREHAENFSWASTSVSLLGLYSSLVD